MAKPTNIFAIAKAYRRAGFSIIPIEADGSKAPAKGCLPNGWKCYQQRQPTEAELREWFGACGGKQPNVGIAVISGTVSGNLEVLDIDSWKCVEPWWAIVKK
jgi:hypothetical protein